MRKSFLLIMLGFAFIQCEKENPIIDDSPNEEDQFLLSLRVDDTYFLTDRYGTGADQVFLTNGRGEVIAQEELQNGATVALESEAADDTYSLTFSHRKEMGEYKIISIHTYLDVPSKTFDLNNNSTFRNEEATFYFLNSGGALEELSFYERSYSWSAGSVGDEGKASYTFGLNSVPEDIFLSFKRKFENGRRYVWVEKVTPESTFTFDCDTLPVINSPVSIHFPENEYLRTMIDGVKEADPGISHHLSHQQFDAGANVSSHYIPEGLFDRFITRATFTVNQKTYRIEKESPSVVRKFEVPDLNIGIRDKSFSNFRMSSSGDYDLFTLEFRYKGENEKYGVWWRFYGGEQEDIRFVIPQLIELILSELPGATQDDFVLSHAQIQRQEGIDSYVHFIELQLGDKPLNSPNGIDFESVSSK